MKIRIFVYIYPREIHVFSNAGERTTAVSWKNCCEVMTVHIFLRSSKKTVDVENIFNCFRYNAHRVSKHVSMVLAAYLF